MILNGKRKLMEFLPLVDLYTTHRDHHRLTVFVVKGRECVACGRVGTLLIVSQEIPTKESRKRGSIGAIHVDLYTDDFILMTVDHITPKFIARNLGLSEEQIESLDNKQPMCGPCNGRKGHKIIDNKELGYRSMQAYRERTKNGQFAAVEVLRELVPNIHRLNDDYMVMAGNLGFEPSHTESKSDALPLG